MKKTLLLSVVASTMIMAGGDIAPVEPVVEAPVEVAGWEFSGQGVVYYQTHDGADMSFFNQDSSAADAGIQLKATNNDVIGGIGAGFAVNGLSTLNLENTIVSGVMQMTGDMSPGGSIPGGGDIDSVTDGGWISEAYLTYGFGNTSIKAGRQTLPKALSPFAFSEDWNVFQNTFDAVLVVNTDISNTTVVGAWVAGNNVNSMMMSNLTDFNSLNEDRGVYMLTVQNKSIENLTLTGSWYYASEFITDDDLNILWGDAQYNAGSFNVGLQGGQVTHDAFDDINAFGAKIGTTLAGVNVGLAYSSVNDGGNNAITVNQETRFNYPPSAQGVFNVGGTTSALYTNTVADQMYSSSDLSLDADKFVVSASMDALGGTISALYAYTDGKLFDDYDLYDNEINEIDVSYSYDVADSLNLTATYAHIDFDDEDLTLRMNRPTDDLDLLRFVARYNF